MRGSATCAAAMDSNDVILPVMLWWCKHGDMLLFMLVCSDLHVWLTPLFRVACSVTNL